MKKIISICISLILCLTLCSCDFMQDVMDLAESVGNVQSKTFEFDGLTIELTTGFLRMDFISDDYDFVVGDGTVTVLGVKSDHDDTELRDLTVMEYAELFRENMEEVNPTEIQEIDGIPTLQYAVDTDDGEQTFAVMYYKGTDCFWVVCFAAYTDIFPDNYDDICKYAKSVQCN